MPKSLWILIIRFMIVVLHSLNNISYNLDRNQNYSRNDADRLIRDLQDYKKNILKE